MNDLAKINKRLHAIERGMDVVASALLHVLIKENLIMATVDDLKAAVAAEAAEVKARIDDLEATVQALKDQIAGGGTITEAQLDEVMVAIQGIFTPTPAPTP
jgi:tetrahydromethanopterin S-methyltransferase subunit G